jgi:ribonuclease P protein component
VNKGISLKSPLASVKTGKFPKSARLLKNTQYKYLHRNSNRLFGQTIIIQFQKGRSTSAKLGITVSKKFGKAHERNRFKRVVREAFRELYTMLPSNFEMNISPQKTTELLSKQALLIELKGMLDKILN